MNQLLDLAVVTSDFGKTLVAAPDAAVARAIIGAGTGSGGVDSVNGKSGTVVLNASDVGALPTSAVGTSVASLVGGKVPSAQMPPLAITSTFVVSSEAAQLALVAEEGDVCIRTDLNQTFIKLSTSLGTMLDWQQLLSPTAPVQSVNGQVGVVSITTTSLGAATAAQGALADTAVQPAALTAGLATKASMPGAWTTQTAFKNGWSDYGATDPNYNRLQYRRVDDTVYIRGLIKKDTQAQPEVMMTLPAGFRPTKQTIMLTLGTFSIDGTTIVRVDVNPAGDLTINFSTLSGNPGSAVWIVLDGLSFQVN